MGQKHGSTEHRAGAPGTSCTDSRKQKATGTCTSREAFRERSEGGRCSSISQSTWRERLILSVTLGKAPAIFFKLFFFFFEKISNTHKMCENIQRPPENTLFTRIHQLLIFCLIYFIILSLPTSLSEFFL